MRPARNIESLAQEYEPFDPTICEPLMDAATDDDAGPNDMTSEDREEDLSKLTVTSLMFLAQQANAERY